MKDALGLEPKLAEACKATLAVIDAQISVLKDPWHKQMLTTWRAHYWGEATGDLEMCMSTMALNPLYTCHGSQVVAAPRMETTEEVRAAYGGFIAMGYRPAGALSNLLFGFNDWGLTIWCLHTFVLPGALMNMKGSIAVEPKQTYQLAMHSMLAFPFDRQTGLITGEHSWMGDPVEVIMIER